MTIYVVSYTSYTEYDYYLYTSHKVFNNGDDALNHYRRTCDSAYGSISDDGEYQGNITVKSAPGKVYPSRMFERLDGYMKIIVELNKYEL